MRIRDSSIPYLREGGLELEELSKDGVELLGDVVLLVGDALRSELEAMQ